MIIWLTGISGAGKTTLAKNLLDLLKMKLVNLVGVDGDEIRTLFGNDLGYHVNDRIKQIKRIQTLTKFLDKQGIHVIASALYFSEEISNWNKNNFSSYYEIYIKASLDLVTNKDVKGIYNKAKIGEEKNIVGIDIKWIEPKTPFLIIDRDSGLTQKAMVNKVIDNIPALKQLKLNNEN